MSHFPFWPEMMLSPVQSMERLRIFWINQDGRDLEGLQRPPSISSEQSRDPGSDKSELGSDSGIVLKFHEAITNDAENGNTRCQDAADLELDQINAYGVFKDLGKEVWECGKLQNPPEGHQEIRVHFGFDIKHDGRHKARFVGDGHLMKETVSGVVSLTSLHLVMFLAQLNQLELWGTDTGNAYLEAWTKEKIFVAAGLEFDELEGPIFMMVKTLYGTRSGGSCWHDKLFDILKKLGPRQILVIG